MFWLLIGSFTRVDICGWVVGYPLHAFEPRQARIDDYSGRSETQQTNNVRRSNIGNAQVAGLDKDLGLVGNQYGTAVTLLYATYVPFEGPVAVLLKIIGPKYLLTVCCLAWYEKPLFVFMSLNLPHLYLLST
jgi:hypothetical protein